MPRDFEQFPFQGEIQRQQVRRMPHGYYEFDDDAAIGLTLSDVSTCDDYMELENWTGTWLDADNLVQSPRNGSNTTQGARVPRFTLSNHLSTIVSKAMSALFYDDPYFQCEGGIATDPDIMEAKVALFGAQLREMEFDVEVERGFSQCALLGTGIFMMGWLDDIEQVKTYKRRHDPETLSSTFLPDRVVHTSLSDEYDIVWDDQEIHRPWFKYMDIRHVLVDPGARCGDIRRAKYVIVRDYLTFRDLNKLRDIQGYDLPNEDDLLSFFFPPKRSEAEGGNQAETLPANLRAWKQNATPRGMDTSIDPFTQTILSYQRWDKDRVIQILQCNGRSLLIRHEANPFHKIPFYSFNWRDLQDCFYGQGLGQLIGMDQRVEEAVLNAALNILGYSVKPTYLRKKGLNVPTQQIRMSLGGIVDVDTDGRLEDAFRIIELPKVPGEAWQAIANAQASAQETSGANQQVGLGAGASGVKTTGMRSGTGAAAVVAANASRLDGPMERFIKQVMKPFLYDMDELNNDRLPSETLRSVLGQELGEEYGNSIDQLEYRKAKLAYDVLAGAHLGANAKKLQAIPLYMQMLNSPAFMEGLVQAGYEISPVDIAREYADLTGTRASKIFKKTTPQKQQQSQANSPAAIAQGKAQAASQMQDKKFQQEQQLEEQRQLGKAAGEQMRTLLEHGLAENIDPTQGLQGTSE